MSEQDDQSLRDARAAGHETADAEPGLLLRFALVLAIITAVCALIVVGLYDYLDKREIREKAGRYPLAVGVPAVLPPPPRLQNSPFTDLKALHKDEARYLDHYAWVDKNAGVVRIPVERAIDILASRGLPHREAPPAGGMAVSADTTLAGGTGAKPAAARRAKAGTE
jgi:hypothetical protein